MKTELLLPNRDAIVQAAQLIQSGEVVAFPTETIYGLFGNATNTDAVSKIFVAKGRPSDNPLIVHLTDKDAIGQYAVIENDLQHLLIESFMPGPFTLVLPKKDAIPHSTTGGLDTVCIRIPDHIVARQIIREAGVPLAGPSANRSGKPSPSSAQMVLRDMDGNIPLIIDGGRTLYGIESTVVKVESKKLKVESKVIVKNGEASEKDTYIIKILRPGFITKEDIEQVVSDRATVVYDDKGVNESPGTRYRHYSPMAKICLRDSDINSLQQQLPELENKKVALIATQEILGHYANELDDLHREYGLITMPLGSINNLLECAQSLYQLYVSADNLAIDQIWIQGLPEQGVGYALMNRIRKSLSSD